jgi:hypothetical protein
VFESGTERGQGGREGVRERWSEGGEERVGRSKREREISFVLALEVNNIHGIPVSLYDIFLYTYVYISCQYTHTHTHTHTRQMTRFRMPRAERTVVKSFTDASIEYCGEHHCHKREHHCYKRERTVVAKSFTDASIEYCGVIEREHLCYRREHHRYEREHHCYKGRTRCYRENFFSLRSQSNTEN